MDIQTAFETLLSHLRQAQREVQNAGERAFKEGRFDEAKRAAQRGEEIHSRIQQLEALRREWARLLGGEPLSVSERSYRRTERPPRGLKVHQDEYWVPILAVLEEMGGRGRVKDVLNRLGELMKHRLSDIDWGVLSDGRSIRWQNTAQWARHDMVKAGLLAPDSPQGLWEITEAGRAYLQEHRAELAALLGAGE